jgi:hypothetical protein
MFRLAKIIRIQIFLGFSLLVSGTAFGQEYRPYEPEVVGELVHELEYDFALMDARLYDRYNKLRRYNQPVVSPRDVQFFIPFRMRPSSDPKQVGMAIALHSMQNSVEFLKNQRGPVANIARTAGQTIKPDLTISRTTGNKELQTEMIHEVKMELELWKKEAAIQYTGLINASVRYLFEQEQISLHIHQKLTETLTLSFAHHQLPDQFRDNLSLRWVF